MKLDSEQAGQIGPVRRSVEQMLFVERAPILAPSLSSEMRPAPTNPPHS